jgi:5-formyltetrahydrofolate cyclo-ligase
MDLCALRVFAVNDMSDVADIKAWKAAVRAEARRRRWNQPDKDALSDRICRQIAATPEFDAAGTILFYIERRSEVRTGPLLTEAYARGKTVVVPYCVGDELRLFRLESTSELSPGAYDILEPRPALRVAAERHVAPAALDLIVVPGVAFDRRGARLGQGKGYYDRLLAEVRGDTFLVAPAFECQIFESVPTLPHDRSVDRVVTESGVYSREHDK